MFYDVYSNGKLVEFNLTAERAKMIALSLFDERFCTRVIRTSYTDENCVIYEETIGKKYTYIEVVQYTSFPKLQIK